MSKKRRKQITISSRDKNSLPPETKILTFHFFFFPFLFCHPPELVHSIEKHRFFFLFVLRYSGGGWRWAGRLGIYFLSSLHSRQNWRKEIGAENFLYCCWRYACYTATSIHEFKTRTIRFSFLSMVKFVYGYIGTQTEFIVGRKVPKFPPPFFSQSRHVFKVGTASFFFFSKRRTWRCFLICNLEFAKLKINKVSNYYSIAQSECNIEEK